MVPLDKNNEVQPSIDGICTNDNHIVEYCAAGISTNDNNIVEDLCKWRVGTGNQPYKRPECKVSLEETSQA